MLMMMVEHKKTNNTYNNITTAEKKIFFLSIEYCYFYGNLFLLFPDHYQNYNKKKIRYDESQLLYIIKTTKKKIF